MVKENCEHWVNSCWVDAVEYVYHHYFISSPYMNMLCMNLWHGNCLLQNVTMMLIIKVSCNKHFTWNPNINKSVTYKQHSNIKNVCSNIVYQDYVYMHLFSLSGLLCCMCCIMLIHLNISYATYSRIAIFIRKNYHPLQLMR